MLLMWLVLESIARRPKKTMFNSCSQYINQITALLTFSHKILFNLELSTQKVEHGLYTDLLSTSINIQRSHFASNQKDQQTPQCVLAGSDKNVTLSQNKFGGICLMVLQKRDYHWSLHIIDYKSYYQFLPKNSLLIHLQSMQFSHILFWCNSSVLSYQPSRRETIALILSEMLSNLQKQVQIVKCVYFSNM